MGKGVRRCVGVVVMHEDRVLVVEKGKRGNKTCSLPKGGIKKGETPEEAAERELREEAAKELKGKKLVITNGESVTYTRRTLDGKIKKEITLLPGELIEVNGKKAKKSRIQPDTRHKASWLTPEQARNRLTHKEDGTALERMLNKNGRERQ